MTDLVENINAAIDHHQGSDYNILTGDDGVRAWWTICDCGEWKTPGEDYAAWEAHRAQAVIDAINTTHTITEGTTS
jgi:hypothetical protein